MNCSIHDFTYASSLRYKVQTNYCEMHTCLYPPATYRHILTPRRRLDTRASFTEYLRIVLSSSLLMVQPWSRLSKDTCWMQSLPIPCITSLSEEIKRGRVRMCRGTPLQSKLICMQLAPWPTEGTDILVFTPSVSSWSSSGKTFKHVCMALYSSR